MIFRLSEKLSLKLRAGRATVPIASNPLADWSSHLFTADRTPYIIVCNTASLYSVVFYARGITNDSRFITSALGTMREFMDDDGLATAYHRWIAPASARVQFARALNRSVTGSMNELIALAILLLKEGEASPHEVGFRLNDTLLSAVRGSYGPYGKPREAFKTLMADSCSWQ